MFGPKILGFLILIVSVITIPSFAQTDAHLSKYGIDVFTDKARYELEETVKIGVKIDPEKFQGYNEVELQIWGPSHEKHQLKVNPEKTYIFEYSPPKSFTGEVKVYASTPKYHDDTFFFVGISNPTLDDYTQQRTMSPQSDYYDQESNPDDYVSLREAQEKRQTEYLLEKIMTIEPKYQIDNPSVYSNITEPEARKLLGDYSKVKKDFDSCWSDVIGFRNDWIRKYVISTGSPMGANIEFDERYDQESMFRNCEINSGIIHWNNLGVILGKKGEFKESIKYFDDALSIHPSYVKVLQNKATSLYPWNFSGSIFTPIFTVSSNSYRALSVKTSIPYFDRCASV